MAAALRVTEFSPAAKQHPACIVGVALVFAIAHLARAGTTAIQLCCFVLTGSLYGFLRLRFQSTCAPVLAHGLYNLALYMSYWFGITN